jgi:hypothetical protein
MMAKFSQEQRLAQELLSGMAIKELYAMAPRRSLLRYVCDHYGCNDHEFLERVTDELHALLANPEGATRP